jgi:hypothetical protein
VDSGEGKIRRHQRKVYVMSTAKTERSEAAKLPVDAAIVVRMLVTWMLGGNVTASASHGYLRNCAQ